MRSANTPEGRLFSAILVQAIRDANLISKGAFVYESGRKKFVGSRGCHKLIREVEHPWMAHVCSMAGVDHKSFIIKINEALQGRLKVFEEYERLTTYTERKVKTDAA